MRVQPVRAEQIPVCPIIKGFEQTASLIRIDLAGKPLRPDRQISIPVRILRCQDLPDAVIASLQFGPAVFIVGRVPCRILVLRLNKECVIGKGIPDLRVGLILRLNHVSLFIRPVLTRNLPVLVIFILHLQRP